jgi:Cof subfamily protein (haloacid dehalogenase superfamily)
MIKLIASDLDGTIIDANGQCHPDVAKTLERVRAMGVKFAICSGRPISSVLPLVAGWGLEGKCDYIIGSNGGEVLETATGKHVKAYTLSPELVCEIFDLYEPLGLIPTLYGEGDELFVQKITPQVEIVAKRIGMRLTTADIRTITKEPQIKSMMILDPELMAAAEGFYQEHKDERYIAFKTAVDLFEFTHPMLAKDVGVQIVGAMMHIEPDEMMAFGDTTNDLDMLRYVKYGIVMENGTDDAKALAYAIAPSVNDAGFAKYLDEYLITPELKQD